MVRTKLTKKIPADNALMAALEKQSHRAKGLPEDMYDEVDAFHKGKDRVTLDPGEDSDPDSEELEGVYNLKDNSEEETSSEEDEDDAEIADCMLSGSKRAHRRLTYWT